MTVNQIPMTPLRRERTRAGLSQVALAARAGCALSTVSLAERGGRLSRSMAKRLATALSVSAEALAGPLEDAAQDATLGPSHPARSLP
jgi:transcriptional regulator with XRE-family HTH domain